MNEEQYAILKQGVAVWNEWRERNSQIHVDLSNADLGGLDLGGANLANANLRRSNLDKARLSEANLTRANLSGAQLKAARLRKTNLTEADLLEAELLGAHLRHTQMLRANLQYAGLNWTDLNEADLRSANLVQASLIGASLIQTRLTKANLSGAHLSRTSFKNSDLEQTEFREANLYEASFISCELNDADLTQAACYRTTFANLDLQSTKGLDKVRHRGPSYIDIETLYCSKGKIPEVFLRGCGIPENLITYLPSLLGAGIEFYSCFISYSHEDKAFAQRVHDTLQGRGIRCWLDGHQMNPGDDIYEEIDRGIRVWDKVILCASEHSLISWWVDNELDTLFEKERELTRQRGEKVKALIPLDLDGYLFSDQFTNGKKRQIQSRIAADFKDWEHDNAIFEREIEKVIKALRTDGGKEPPPTPKL